MSGVTPTEIGRPGIQSGRDFWCRGSAGAIARLSLRPGEQEIYTNAMPISGDEELKSENPAREFWVLWLVIRQSRGAKHFGESDVDQSRILCTQIL